MYIKRIYSLKDMLLWTWRDSVLFATISALYVTLYEVLGQTWIVLPWLPIAMVGTSVAFILSFQNNAAYGRAWEARKIWGGIVNASRSFGFMVNDFITNEFTDKKASEEELASIRRELVMRHIGWMAGLRHGLRSERPWETFTKQRSNTTWAEQIGIREHLVSLEDELKDYLAAEECAEVLSKSNAATQILAGQSRQLRELRNRDLIEDFRHMQLQGALTELVALQGKAERIKNFPYPRQYATLNAVFLWIFIALVPLGIMHEFRDLIPEVSERYPLIGKYFTWMSIPLSVVVMWVFHTTERIGRVTENPFEGSANDVPITTMSRGIEIDMREMLGEDPQTIPKPLPVKWSTQT